MFVFAALFSGICKPWIDFNHTKFICKQVGSVDLDPLYHISTLPPAQGPSQTSEFVQFICKQVGFVDLDPLYHQHKVHHKQVSLVGVYRLLTI